MAHYASSCMAPVFFRGMGQVTLMSRVQNEVAYRQMAVDQVPYPSSWREEKGVPGDKVVILELEI